MATGTAVSTGDIITAAKMNLKQEDGSALTVLGVLDQSGAGAQDLRIVCSENLTANRNLTITVNDAARAIDLGGDLTLAGAFTTSGAFGLTLTITALTNVTLPTTGTLATLAGTETLTNKTITAATLSGTFPGTPTFSGATITFTGGTIALTGGAAYAFGTTDAFALNLRAGGANRLGISNTIGTLTMYQTTANYTLTFADPAAARTITFPDPLGADSVAYLAATQTFTNKTINGAVLSGTLSGTPTLSGTVAFTATSPFSIANAQTLTVSVTAQTVGAATLTIPNFANVNDTFAFITLAQTLVNKTLTAPDINGGTADSLTSFSIRSTGAAFDMLQATAAVFTANRTLTWAMGDAARSITMAGNINIAADLITSGANSLTLTTTGATNVTLPTTGTLATIAGVETLTNKSLTAPAITGGTAIELTTFSLRSSGAAFDLVIATTAVYGADRTLTINIPTGANAALTLTGDLIRAGAHSLTLTTTGATDVTLPTTGTLATLAGTESLSGKTISMAGNLTFASALDIVVQAATAAALEISDGTTKVYAVDTRIAVDNVVHHSFDATNSDYASAAGSTNNLVQLAAHTVNLTGGVGVTATDGLQLDIQAPSLTAGQATTVTTASTVMLRPVTAGANITITNSRMINTSVAGCFLTAAGVWTDASSIQHKTGVEDVDFDRVLLDLQAVRAVTYERKDRSDGGFRRYGVIAEEVPNFLATPERTGIAALDLAGFTLAGLKALQRQYEVLQEEVKRIGGLLRQAG